MRGLDDAGNPYSGQYSSFDRWAFDHYVNYYNPKTDSVDEILAEPGSEMYYISVDKEGYVVPTATQLEWRFNPPEGYEPSPCSFTFTAAGVAPVEDREWLMETAMQCLAAAVPEIPGWLAEDPPEWAAPVRDGEFLTLGRLGSGKGLPSILNDGQLYNMPHLGTDSGGYEYCRYSPEGELIAIAPKSKEWWKMFFTDFDEVLAKRAGHLDVEVREYTGTIVIYAKDGWQELGVFDFYGNELPAGTDKYGSIKMFTWLYGGNIPLIAKYQQGGKTDAVSEMTEASGS